jgi:tripartite ATP-independent transporter DctP family solute receptor
MLTMSRRRLLAGATAIGTFNVFHYPADAAEFTFKLGHEQGVTHPQNVFAQAAAKKIIEESGGRLIVRVYPNSQLGGTTQMLQQLRSGALELMQIGDNVLADVVPASALAGIPFAFADFNALFAAMDGPFGTYVRHQVEKAGLFVFEKGWVSGWRNIFTVDHRADTPSDMRNMKMRVPESPMLLEIYRAFGASPVSLNNAEAYTSMQTHLVDGADSTLVSIEATKAYEVIKYATLSQHAATSYQMAANPGAWRRLPANLQEILARNLNEAAISERAAVVGLELSLQKTLTDQGVRVITPDRGVFRQAVRSAALYDKWRNQYGSEGYGLLEQSSVTLK